MQSPLALVPESSSPSAPKIAGQRNAGRAASRRASERNKASALELWVEPWVDLCPDDGRSYHPKSPYVEFFWLGVLGPSATWLIRRLAMQLEQFPDGVTVNTAEIASELGLGGRSALHAAFNRAFERCCRFRLMQRGRHGTLFVRMRLPSLTVRMVERLPPRLKLAHDLWPQPAVMDPPGVEALARARQLALALLTCGDDPDSVEQQLHSWHFHPAVAFEAARWATERHTRAQAFVDQGERAGEARTERKTRIGGGRAISLRKTRSS